MFEMNEEAEEENSGKFNTKQEISMKKPSEVKPFSMANQSYLPAGNSKSFLEVSKEDFPARKASLMQPSGSSNNNRQKSDIGFLRDNDYTGNSRY